jgi:hypothetical protein
MRASEQVERLSYQIITTDEGVGPVNRDGLATDSTASPAFRMAYDEPLCSELIHSDPADYSENIRYPYAIAANECLLDALNKTCGAVRRPYPAACAA